MQTPKQRRPHHSIAQRLRWSYVISSTLPLVVVGALLLVLNLNAQQSSVYRDQRSTAQRVARDIDRYVGSLRTQLESYTLRVRPNVARSQLIEAAQNTEARNFPDLIEMSVIDASGAEQVRVTRLQSAPDSALQVYADKPEVQQALQQGQISYSPIRMGSDQKLVFELTLPVRNDAGRVTGALVARISADPIVHELQSVDAEARGYAYLVHTASATTVTDDGVVGESVASQLGQMLANDSTIGEYVGARGESVIGALAPVTVGEKHEPTGWMIVVEQPSATAFGTIWTSAILLSLLVLLAGTLALLWAWQQAKRLLQPLTGLRTGAAMLGAGHLEYRIERISDDEFGDVSVAFNTMAGHLQQSLDEIAQQNDRLRRGLALARDIQIGLLPDRPPWSQDAMSVYARSLPAYEVGGDFYTYLALNEGRTAIAIGDISGKGVGAALLMALTASAVESQGRQLEHPAQVLVALNQLLAPRLQANHMNAALQFVVFDPATATLRIANAGMIAPVLINKSGSRFIDVGGLPLGAFSGAKYQEAEVTLEPGDTLLLVSDGVVEAHNLQGELFGFEQLEHLLAEQPANDLSTLVEMVLARVQDHIGKAEQHDDITIVAVRPQIRSDKARTHEEQAIDYAVV